MIEKSEGALDFNMSAKELCNLIMGLSPSPGAFLDLNGLRLKVYKAVLGGETSYDAGVIAEISKKGISIACGDGKTVVLTVVQKQGKNKTDAYSYACGAKLAVGESLR